MTFGLILVIYDLIKILWGTDVKTVATPALLKGSISIFNQIVPITSLFIIAVGLLDSTRIVVCISEDDFRKNSNGYFP